MDHAQIVLITQEVSTVKFHARSQRVQLATRSFLMVLASNVHLMRLLQLARKTVRDQHVVHVKRSLLPEHVSHALSTKESLKIHSHVNNLSALIGKN